MTVVARHPIDVAASDVEADRLLNGMPRIVDAIVRDPAALFAVMTQSLDEAGHRTAGDNRAAWADTWRAVVRAMQASSAIFVVAGQPAGEVSFRVDYDVVSRAGTGPLPFADAFTWLRALYLAMICRERARIDALAATPVELLRASGSAMDEYAISWVRTWQTYWRGEGGLVDLIIETMRGTNPEQLRHVSEEATLRIHYPPIELFYRLTQREDDKFNDALADAVDLHRLFWTKDSPEFVRSRHPGGYIALAPLAIACLARDAGIAITVESDYLPVHLLEATRVGEITT
ncbi:immunity protein 49 of polymorphic toxin system [Herbihabitans rhizosphaerae]|uniref:Immunity protein 49 of polymorphic toxin system n=1 Tax=Herbihabitans rhizosphaerae TaxID=1872711 RepID=A0A4Q7KGT0_9PSEU|nr:immunity 49 family protein [Herbihabitans rhizosphaerae]RZS34070.1 immunity protein 49 of polymorphic toxin system [Herbihabitans rhizosphaerae]